MAPSQPAEHARIVDVIFARGDRAGRRRWFIALGGAAGIYGLLFGVLPLLARPPARVVTAPRAEPVHEIAIEAPPPPPSPPANHPHAAGRTKAPHARPPAPATAGALIARTDPVDFGGTTFVAGQAAAYTGGATTTGGTNPHAVEERTVDPRGADDVAGVSLDDADWSCPWPPQADGADINEQVVILKVAVEPDGSVKDARILSDPGSGFGRAAQLCALRTRFHPAQDRAGTRIFAWSAAIRVRFIR